MKCLLVGCLVVQHHTVCPVMPNGDPEGQNLVLNPHTNYILIFLIKIKFRFCIFLKKVPDNTELSILLTSCLTAIKSHVIKYCTTVYEKKW